MDFKHCNHTLFSGDFCCANPKQIQIVMQDENIIANDHIYMYIYISFFLYKHILHSQDNSYHEATSSAIVFIHKIDCH